MGGAGDGRGVWEGKCIGGLCGRGVWEGLCVGRAVCGRGCLRERLVGGGGRRDCVWEGLLWVPASIVSASERGVPW